MGNWDFCLCLGQLLSSIFIKYYIFKKKSNLRKCSLIFRETKEGWGEREGERERERERERDIDVREKH